MSPNPPTQNRPPTPRVWSWYIALCVLMAALNAGAAALGMWVFNQAEYLSIEAQTRPDYWRNYGTFLVLSGVVFGILNLLLPLIPKKPWAYLVHMGNILACVFCCLPAPLAVPVLIYFLKPDAREMFGMK